ncbi:MAG: proline--tRNA ligase, partial [Bacteroidetes bacterium]
WEEFTDLIENKGGFVYAHWDGTAETENKIKDKTKASIRLIPIEDDMEEGICILTGKPSKRRVVFAKAY